MQRFLLVCLGGAAGSGTRYLVSSWAARSLGGPFPWATLLVNLAGCFLLGLIMQVALTTATLSVEVRLLLTTGVMGGLTTYSTFNYESIKMWQEGATRLALVNVGVTTLGCLAAGLAGLAVGRSLAT